MMLRLGLGAVLAGVAAATSTSNSSLGPKKVMLWMANPYPEPADPPKRPHPTTVQSMIDGLKPHRMAFTGLAYQYFAICGEGSNDIGGSNDCHPKDATGAPHLAPGHPILTPPDLGASLTAGLGKGFGGSALELWPTISYGNPGNSSVLNKLYNNDTAVEQFIADAVAIAHKQSLTGFNLDLETQGVDMTKAAAFLQKLGSGLHAASPPIKLSYDAGNTPVAGVTAMDRWVSMGTYTSNTPAYISGLATGVKACGSKFGVGLCPVCNQLSENDTETRFTEIRKYGEVVREIDLWAADYHVPASDEWKWYWPRLEKWLQSP